MIGTYDIYSKRNSVNNNDVFVYDVLPKKLKNQFIHIINDIFDSRNYQFAKYKNDISSSVYKILLKEYGLQYLVDEYETQYGFEKALYKFLSSTEQCEYGLDLIELFIKVLIVYVD